MSRFLLSVCLLLSFAAAAQEAAQPTPLVAQLPAGEVLTYDFEQDVRITTHVRPAFADAPGLFKPERTYRLTGRFSAALSATDPGAASVRLHDLKLASWQSAEDAAPLVQLLRQLQGITATVRLQSGPGERIVGLDQPGRGPMETHALQMIQAMLALALDTKISDRPVTAGQRWVEQAAKSQGFTENWYRGDVTLAGRRCALIVAQHKSPPETEPLDLGPEARAAGVQGKSVISTTLGGGALFDLEARRIAWTRSSVSSDTMISVLASDPDGSVRIPRQVMSIRADVQTSTRLQRPEVANWSAALNAFASAADVGPGSAPEQSATAVADEGEISLGEQARRAREAKALERR